MTTSRWRARAAVAALSVAACLPAVLSSGSAAAQGAASSGQPASPAAKADPAALIVQDFYEALFDSMRHARELKMKGRYDRLYPVMLKLFDVPTMTRLATGPDFTALTPDQQTSLREAFGRLLVATFASTFDDFKGETYAVDDTPVAQGSDRMVKSRFNGEGAPVPINFLVRQKGDDWRVVDIYLNGNISQLATWRSEYAATFRDKGYEGLILAVQSQTDKDMKAF